jgi:predicted amidohydrolase YtcJ
MSTLYVNGTIHSTSDPYATALLVDGGSVAWVGADDTAESMRSRSGADWQVVDLDGALVVPAFVDSLAPAFPGTSGEPGAGAGPAQVATAAAAAGIFLSVTTTDAGEPASHSGDRGRTIGYRPLDAAEADATPRELAALLASGDPADSSGPTAVPAGLAAVVGAGGLDAAATARLADRATEAGIQVYFLPRDPDAFGAVVAAIEATAAHRGTVSLGMARHRVSWNGPVGAQAIATLARNSLSLTVAPQHDRAEAALAAPIASLLAAGVPVSFGSGSAAPDPWAAVRAGLEHADPDQRISARSGFTAATKAGLRALPHSIAAHSAQAGRIAPSAAATFGIWAAEALSVQAPDGRVAAWSTDTRAGTPLLPVLEEGTAAPVCLATVVDGVEVHRSAGRPAA